MKFSRLVSGFFRSPGFLWLTLGGNLFLLVIITSVFFLEKDVNPQMGHFFDALWWGVTTITTVGYGDIVPMTLTARILGVLLMYTGTVLFVAFTSIVAAYLVRAEMRRKIGPVERKVEKEVIEVERVERMLKEIHKKLEKWEGPK